MAHNVGQQKQDLQPWQAAIERLRKYVAPGWRVAGNFRTLAPEPTLLGYQQRGQALLFRCHGRDCSRRVQVDLEAAIKVGVGGWSVADLHNALFCSHPGGCRLKEESSVYPKGVPLAGYVGTDAMVSVICATCGGKVVLTPEAVADRLRASGRGDAATSLLQVGERIRGPCRKCGGRSFRSEVVWPNRTARSA